MAGDPRCSIFGLLYEAYCRLGVLEAVVARRASRRLDIEPAFRSSVFRGERISPFWDTPCLDALSGSFSLEFVEDDDCPWELFGVEGPPGG